MPAVYSADGKENCAEEAVEEKTDFIQKLERGEKVFVVELDPPFDVYDTKLMEGAALLRDINVDMIRWPILRGPDQEPIRLLPPSRCVIQDRWRQCRISAAVTRT